MITMKVVTRKFDDKNDRGKKITVGEKNGNGIKNEHADDRKGLWIRMKMVINAISGEE